MTPAHIQRFVGLAGTAASKMEIAGWSCITSQLKNETKTPEPFYSFHFPCYMEIIMFDDKGRMVRDTIKLYTLFCCAVILLLNSRIKNVFV